MYESISEIVNSPNKKIINLYNLNITYNNNIRSLNADYEELVLFLENYIH